MPDRPPDAVPTVTGPPAVESDTGASDASGALLAFDRLAASDAASTPVPASDPTAAELPAIPGYLVHRLLGEGGMGAVYLATDTRLRKDVALKVLPAAEAGELLRRRFVDEAATLAKFDHPNIVRVFSAGEANGWLYFAMTFLPLGSLDRHLKAVRRDAATVAALLAKVARAVHHLHTGGVLHRDLKPQNILLAADGEPQVADFGIAKMTDGDDRTPTQTGARLGTFAYMSPEMVQHGVTACGPATDVWAVGLMLYELLAGRRPFLGSGRDPNLLFRIVAHAPPPLLSEPGLTPGTDDRLEAIVLRALAKDPAHRYPTAAGLADDLDQWLSGQLPPAPLELLAVRRQHAAPRPSSAVDADAPTVTAAPPAAKPRRRMRAVGWLAAGLLLATTAVVVAAMHELPVAAVVAKYGECVIVDADGRQLRKLTKIGGSQGEANHDAENRCLRTSGSPVALYEISDVAPEPPYRLRAKVYHSWGDQNNPFHGIYVRRGQLPSPVGPHAEHDLFAAGIDAVGVGNDTPGSVSSFVVCTDLNPQSEVAFFPTELHARRIPRHVAEAVPTGYRSLMIDVYPHQVVMWYEGVSATPRSWKLVENTLGQQRPPGNRPAPAALLGDGFGLIVTRGTALFRDVVVERLPPNP